MSGFSDFFENLGGFLLVLLGIGLVVLIVNFPYQVLGFLLIGGLVYALGPAPTTSEETEQKGTSCSSDSDCTSDGSMHPVTGGICMANSDGSLTDGGITSHTWSTDNEGGTQTVSFTEDSDGNLVCTDSDSSQASSSNYNE